MNVHPQQLDLDIKHAECAMIRLRRSAARIRRDLDRRTIRDLRKANKRLERAIVSSRIALLHAKEALRIARGGSFSPSQRNRIDGSYQMIRSELGEAA